MYTILNTFKLLFTHISHADYWLVFVRFVFKRVLPHKIKYDVLEFPVTAKEHGLFQRISATTYRYTNNYSIGFPHLWNFPHSSAQPSNVGCYHDTANILRRLVVLVIIVGVPCQSFFVERYYNLWTPNVCLTCRHQVCLVAVFPVKQKGETRHSGGSA